MENKEQKAYTVYSYGEIYGKESRTVRAYTPYDAADKAKKRMPWRRCEDVVKQIVELVEDKTKVWEFGGDVG